MNIKHGLILFATISITACATAPLVPFEGESHADRRLASDTFDMISMITAATGCASIDKIHNMGNMDALRDWGHPKDYVEMQWLMLQQDEPDDFVIATGVQYSVRQFIEKAALRLGIEIKWQGSGEDEVGVIAEAHNIDLLGVLPGDIIVRIDPHYYRPTEVESLLGDPSKAKDQLGWVPQITFDELVTEIVDEDLLLAKQDSLVEKSGFKTYVYN
jgi:GDPmannose 4,6-dehydratase